MEFTDTHVHLMSHQFDADREAVWERARAAGVTRLLACGSDLASSAAELAFAQAHAGVSAAVGIHAHKASSALDAEDGALDEAAFATLTSLAAMPGMAAIGEIGLDYHYDFSPRPAQHAVLRRQLQLAVALDKPVILHNRESDADLRALVDDAPRALRGVLHCFLADRAMAEWAIARGLYIGVGGPLTFKNIHGLREIIRALPLERLLLETDCPYLAPHPHRGGRNEPAYVVHVADKLAQLFERPLEEIAARTAENAARLFGMS
jgi:TatD DNase family protein